MSLSSTPARLTLLALLSASTFYCFYKSRRLKLLKVSLNAKDNLDANPVSSSNKGKLFFITQTGTSKTLAQRLHNLLKLNDLPFDLMDIKDYEPEDLSKETLVIIIASTWEDGKPPSNASFFANWLAESADDFRVGSLLLSKCKFSVFGVGSAAYGDTFNAVAKGFSRRLRDLGANEIVEVGEGDVDGGELDLIFEEWSGKVLRILKGGSVQNGTVFSNGCVGGGISNPKIVKEQMAKQMMRCLISIPLISRALSPPPAIYLTLRAQRSLATDSADTFSDGRMMQKKKQQKSEEKKKAELLAVKRKKEKRRTRSEKEFGSTISFDFHSNENHIPVMLGEVVDVFSSVYLRSFVDCTLGAAGHSSAIIQAHPELENYVGMDVDPVAHAKARACIDALLHSHSHLKAQTFIRNFKHIKSLLADVDPRLLHSGVDAILMDLGMSSMQVNNPERGFSVLANGPLDMRMDPQATLKAEDILNCWPDTEVGRVLREYGEESNWRLLQNKIVQARVHGGLHSTGDLVDLVRSATHGRGGRQGWIKTATRVFQALRIAVNDELNTLEKSLNACFESLAPGGRLAVISFHSLEDRIVKQTFLSMIEIDRGDGDVDVEERGERDIRKTKDENNAKETWIRSMVHGRNGTILTKRPITPSEEEEKLNVRSRSAKLRVIEKV